MIKNTNSKLKKAVSWLAYVDPIALSFPQLKPLRPRWGVDKGPGARHDRAHPHRRKLRCSAGGFLLMPEAKPDDGILDIAALPTTGSVRMGEGVAQGGVGERRAAQVVHRPQDHRPVQGRARMSPPPVRATSPLQLGTPRRCVRSPATSSVSRQPCIFKVDPGSVILKVPAATPDPDPATSSRLCPQQAAELAK